MSKLHARNGFEILELVKAEPWPDQWVRGRASREGTEANTRGDIPQTGQKGGFIIIRALSKYYISVFNICNISFMNAMQL